jgi:hypothetical protein
MGGERWPGLRSEPCGVDATLTDVGEISHVPSVIVVLVVIIVVLAVSPTFARSVPND